MPSRLKKTLVIALAGAAAAALAGALAGVAIRPKPGAFTETSPPGDAPEVAADAAFPPGPDTPPVSEAALNALPPGEPVASDEPPPPPPPPPEEPQSRPPQPRPKEPAPPADAPYMPLPEPEAEVPAD